jgi:hypothetical protein
MTNALHFVGFKDDRYNTAVKVFGKPDFIHRFWDRRAQREIAEGDVIVFAKGDESQAFGPNGNDITEFTYDDSAHF